MLPPTCPEIVLSPEFMLLFVRPNLYCNVPGGAVLHIAKDNLKKKKGDLPNRGKLHLSYPFSVQVQAK